MAAGLTQSQKLPHRERNGAKKKKKFIHEGRYVAEVDVDLIDSDTGWSPSLSVEDAYKLDEVRDALTRGDIKAASKYARVFFLTPIAI